MAGKTGTSQVRNISASERASGVVANGLPAGWPGSDGSGISRDTLPFSMERLTRLRATLRSLQLCGEQELPFTAEAGRSRGIRREII